METKKLKKKLVNKHWAYIEQMLKVHGEKKSSIIFCPLLHLGHKSNFFVSMGYILSFLLYLPESFPIVLLLFHNPV